MGLLKETMKVEEEFMHLKLSVMHLTYFISIKFTPLSIQS